MFGVFIIRFFKLLLNVLFSLSFGSKFKRSIKNILLENCAKLFIDEIFCYKKKSTQYKN